MEAIRAFQVLPVMALARQDSTVILVLRVPHNSRARKDTIAQLVRILHALLELLRALLGLAPNFNRYAHLGLTAPLVPLVKRNAPLEHIITLLVAQVVLHAYLAALVPIAQRVL